jgi:hypothetical protein
LAEPGRSIEHISRLKIQQPAPHAGNDPYQTFRASSAGDTQQNPPNRISIGSVLFDPEQACLPDVLPSLDLSNDQFFIGHTKCNAIKVQTRIWIVGVRKATVFFVVRISASLRNGVQSANERLLFANVVEKALDRPMGIGPPISNRKKNFFKHTLSSGRTQCLFVAESGWSAKLSRLPG